MRDLKKYENSYIGLPFEDTQVMYRTQKTLETATKYKPRSILEVGCGLKPFALNYQEFEKFSIIEPCDDFFFNAQKIFEMDKRVRVIKGLLQDKIECLSTDQYDLILISSLLHEVDCSQLILESAFLLCNSDTVIHINVPNANSFHRLLALEMGLISNVTDLSQTQIKMQQAHTYDINTLENLVCASGFEVIEKGTFFIKPFTHKQMAELQSVGIGNKSLLDGLYKISKYFPEYGSEIFMNIRKKV